MSIEDVLSGAHFGITESLSYHLNQWIKESDIHVGFFCINDLRAYT